MDMLTLKIFKVLVVVVCIFGLSGCTTDIFQKPLKSGLQIVTEGSKASVFVNSQYLDKTPLVKKDFKPGEYYIEIKPDDEQLAPYETSVTLRGGFITVLIWKFGITPQQSGGVTYEMEQLADANKTEVEFNSIPDGAFLEISGTDKNFTPAVLDQFKPGILEYKLSLPSYETQEHSIDLIAGYRAIVTAKLAKIPQEGIATPAPTTKPSTAVIPTGAENSTATASAKFVKIKSTKLFIDGNEVLRARSGPSVTSEQVGLVKVGNKYPLLGEPTDGWLQIKLDNGAAAFVSGAYGEME